MFGKYFYLSTLVCVLLPPLLKRADCPVIVTECYKAVCLNCFRLHNTPSHSRISPSLLLKSHVWDTHVHVSLRRHSPAIDLYKLDLENTQLSISSLPSQCSPSPRFMTLWHKEAGLQPKHWTGNHLIWLEKIYLWTMPKRYVLTHTACKS